MTYQNPKYPLFADMSGQKVFVIGAGNVAERKIETLVRYGAKVNVIAPEATARIHELVEEGSVVYEQRAYCPGDLKDAFLVICATDNQALNAQVFEEAKSHGRLVNVVDAPELCNFYVPSIVARGPLQIAISTSGAAPTVAKKLRRELSERYGEEWGTYVSLLGELRALVLERVPGGEEEHKPIFSMLAASDLYERVAAGETLDIEGLYEELVVPFGETVTTSSEKPNTYERAGVSL
ncbi:MAG TPA: precorrin-2 oxidase [Coriobacteriia bacterium]|nr:precorrin-2 oxidase [Coriobacteriia bacterium]